MLKNNSKRKYQKYILAVCGLVMICFALTLTTQIGVSLMPPSPYEPAYYGWPNTIAGRRILVVFDTEMNPCSPEHRKTIVVETLDTMTETSPISSKPTLSPPEVVLTLDPTGHTTIMERPFFTKSILIRNYISQLEFFRTAGCSVSGVALWPILGLTNDAASVQHSTPTPVVNR